MSRLKSEIKKLEASVMADHQEFILQRTMLINQMMAYKKETYIFGLMFGGFTLGYMLGPSKGHLFKRAITGGMFFLNASRWLQSII